MNNKAPKMKVHRFPRFVRTVKSEERAQFIVNELARFTDGANIQIGKDLPGLGEQIRNFPTLCSKCHHKNCFHIEAYKNRKQAQVLVIQRDFMVVSV